VPGLGQGVPGVPAATTAQGSDAWRPGAHRAAHHLALGQVAIFEPATNLLMLCSGSSLLIAQFREMRLLKRFEKKLI